MNKPGNRYLYAVYIAEASQNRSYGQYRMNIRGLPDHSAIDHGGVQNGALVSVGISAADLRRVLTHQFRPENRGDLRIIEITSVTLAEIHLPLAPDVRSRFLTGKYHYPHIQN